MVEVIIEHWDKLALGCGAILAFFGGRKTKVSKEKKEEAGALNSMQTAYNEFVIDQKEFVKDQKMQMDSLKLDLLSYRSELEGVKLSLVEAKKEIKTWKTKYNTLVQLRDMLDWLKNFLTFIL